MVCSKMRYVLCGAFFSLFMFTELFSMDPFPRSESTRGKKISLSTFKYTTDEETVLPDSVTRQRIVVIAEPLDVLEASFSGRFDREGESQITIGEIFRSCEGIVDYLRSQTLNLHLINIKAKKIIDRSRNLTSQVFDQTIHMKDGKFKTVTSWDFE